MDCWCPTKEGHLHLKWWIFKRINQDRWVQCLCPRRKGAYQLWNSSWLNFFTLFILVQTLFRKVVVSDEQDTIQNCFWGALIDRKICLNRNNQMKQMTYLGYIHIIYQPIPVALGPPAISKSGRAWNEELIMAVFKKEICKRILQLVISEERVFLRSGDNFMYCVWPLQYNGNSLHDKDNVLFYPYQVNSRAS